MTMVNREERTGQNVVGFIPASDSTDASKPFVMLGAHYDHLGHGTGGNSLARDNEAGDIHNGADDNASGVAAVLSAAVDLAQMNRQRGIILGFWSGEELGLLGSADFVKAAPVPMEQVAAYLNFDMVGRLRDNRLSVQAVGTSSIWIDMIETLNDTFKFDIQFVADPYLPTDVISFNQVEVPSLAFFTGSHEDYHRPSDDADGVNYAGLDRISALGTAVAQQLVNRIEPPDFIKAEPAVQTSGRGPIRIFTGTIPDYSDEAEGLLLSGVVGGGPAQAAGLDGGDVIVELAGRTIANIYDYTYALDLLKVGEPATVVFIRDGQRQETTLTPEARE
jgi:Zn-dependent M28 family amino/carboxypeptidase